MSSAHERVLWTVNEFRVKRFAENSRPTPRTVRKWVKHGDVDGEIYGGTYYVYADQKAASTGNKMADALLLSL